MFAFVCFYVLIFVFNYYKVKQINETAKYHDQGKIRNTGI